MINVRCFTVSWGVFAFIQWVKFAFNMHVRVVYSDAKFLIKYVPKGVDF